MIWGRDDLRSRLLFKLGHDQGNRSGIGDISTAKSIPGLQYTGASASA